MTRRRLLGVAAVVMLVALAIFSIGGRDATQPVAVADARPAPGDYSGRSGQGLPIAATVADDRGTLRLEIRWRCVSSRDPAAGGVQRFRHSSVTIERDGTFSGTADVRERLAPGVHRSARFTGGTTPSGTLRGTWGGEYEHVTEDTEVRCSSGDVTFEARRRRSLPDTDASGQPVVALDGPREVAAAAGRVWVLEEGQTAAAVVRIDPASAGARARTPIGTVPTKAVAPPGVAFPPVLAAGEGAAWVVTGFLGPRFELTRVDARTERVERIAVAPPAPRAGGERPFFQSIAAGAGGLWMLVGDRVLRLDPRSGRIVATIALTPAAPARSRDFCGRPGSGSPPAPQADRLAIGAGAVWVASKCGPRPSRYGFLSRIDPRTNRVTRAVALRRSYARIAAGPAGVWAVTATAVLLTPRPPEPALHRIDLRDGSSAAVTPLPAGDVVGLAVGRGAVWVARAGGSRPGALHRVHAAGGRLKTVRRLERPSGLAVDGGQAWIVDAFADTLRRAPVR